jgi:O-antigen ligase
MLEALQYPYSLAALIALVLLFWRPAAGLIFLVAIFPVDPFSPRLPVPGMNTETILLGVAFAMTVLRFGARLPPLRYSGPVIAFIVVMGMGLVLSIPWAIKYTAMDGEPAVWFIFKSWKSMSFSALFFFASYWWLGRPEDRARMLEAISFGVWISAVAGVADFVFGLTDIGALGRATGLQGDPNAMAEAVGSMMFVSLHLAVYGLELPLWRRLFHGSAYALSFVALVLSLSRGNWLALVFAHAVYFLLVNRTLFFATVVAVAMLATVAFPLLPEVVRGRILSTVQTSNTVYGLQGAAGLETSAAMRVVFTKIGYDMWLESPLWGQGLSSFTFRAPELGARYGLFQTKDAHNILVKLAAENGVIGLAAFMWLVWAVFRCGRRLWRADSREYQLGAVLLAAGTHALLASLSTDSFLYAKQISAYFWVLYALCARAYVERFSVAEARAPQPVAGARWRRFSHSTPAAASQS